MTLDAYVINLGQDYGKFGEIVGGTIIYLSEHKVALEAIAGAIGGILLISIVAATAAMLTFIGVSLPVILIAAAIGAAATLVMTNWKPITTFFTNLWTTVVNAFNTAKTSVSKIMTELWTGIKKVFSDSINSIIGMFNTFIDAINGIKIDIPGVDVAGKKIAGFKWNGLNLPKIPLVSFDTGGWVGQSGLAILHAGEFVLSKDMLSGREPVPSITTTTNQPININAFINSDVDLALLGQRLAWELRNSR